MTPDHYESLRVAPGADDAVIRAAYRALMRTYHPDRNHEPDAQSRVREITAAFAVLGDPAKRAAYDAAKRFGDELAIVGQVGPLQRPRPPMRNFGLASIALAFALTVALAVRPDSAPTPAPPATPSPPLACASAKAARGT